MMLGCVNYTSSASLLALTKSGLPLRTVCTANPVGLDRSAPNYISSVLDCIRNDLSTLSPLHESQARGRFRSFGDLALAGLSCVLHGLRQYCPHDATR